jgi:hypothetical protein
LPRIAKTKSTIAAAALPVDKPPLETLKTRRGEASAKLSNGRNSSSVRAVPNKPYHSAGIRSPEPRGNS